MITKYKFKNFYYNSFNHISKNKVFKLLFDKKVNSDINDYFKKTYNSYAEFFFLSARSSLFFFLKNYKNDKSKRVLVTSFTCDSVLVSIINAGYEPILVDIEKENFSMDISDILKIDKNLYSIILIQHTFGIPAKYLIEIKKFCNDNNKILIEDCALSFFSKLNNQRLGSYGDVAMFSFELSKSITTQKGGCLIINNKHLNIDTMYNKYNEIKFQPKIKEFRKNIQIILSIYLYNSKFYNIWYYLLKILYNLFIFEKSTPKIEKNCLINKDNFLLKMNIFHRKLLSLQILHEKEIINEINDNYTYIKEKLISNKLNLKLNYLNNTNYIIRLPLVIDDKKKFLKKLLPIINFEVGYWFKNLALDERFIKFQKNKINNKNCINSQLISEKIINIPLNLSKQDRYYYDPLIRILNDV